MECTWSSNAEANSPLEGLATMAGSCLLRCPARYADLASVSRRLADGNATDVWFYANNWDWHLVGYAGFCSVFPRLPSLLPFAMLGPMGYVFATARWQSSLRRSAISVDQSAWKRPF